MSGPDRTEAPDADQLTNEDVPAHDPQPPDHEVRPAAEGHPIEREPSERDLAARARGLAAPYLPGGRDPDPQATSKEERRYIVALIGMVALIVGTSIVLTIVGIIAGAFGTGH